MSTLWTPGIWIANAGLHAVTKLSLAGLPLLTRQFPVGFDPQAIHVGYDANPWVTNRGTTAGSAIKLGSTTGQNTHVFDIGNDTRGVTTDFNDNSPWIASSPIDKVVKFAGTSSIRGTYIVGDRPVAMATDRRSNVWIANMTEGSISRFTFTGLQLPTVPMPGTPYEMAPDFDTGADEGMWVIRVSSKSMVKVSSTSGKPIMTIATGSLPVCVATSRLGTIWVGHSIDKNIIKFSTTNGAILGTYTAGDFPTGIAVDEDENIWVCNFNQDSVSKLSPTGLNLLTVSVGFGPRTLGDFTGYSSYPVYIKEWSFVGSFSVYNSDTAILDNAVLIVVETVEESFDGALLVYSDTVDTFDANLEVSDVKIDTFDGTLHVGDTDQNEFNGAIWIHNEAADVTNGTLLVYTDTADLVDGSLVVFDTITVTSANVVVVVVDTAAAKFDGQLLVYTDTASIFNSTLVVFEKNGKLFDARLQVFEFVTESFDGLLLVYSSYLWPFVGRLWVFDEDVPVFNGTVHVALSEVDLFDARIFLFSTRQVAFDGFIFVADIVPCNLYSDFRLRTDAIALNNASDGTYIGAYGVAHNKSYFDATLEVERAEHPPFDGIVTVYSNVVDVFNGEMAVSETIERSVPGKVKLYHHIIYIANTYGSDTTGTGTFENPYRTFEHANSVAWPHDIIRVIYTGTDYEIDDEIVPLVDGITYEGLIGDCGLYPRIIANTYMPNMIRATGSDRSFSVFQLHFIVDIGADGMTTILGGDDNAQIRADHCVFETVPAYEVITALVVSGHNWQLDHCTIVRTHGVERSALDEIYGETLPANVYNTIFVDTFAQDIFQNGETGFIPNNCNLHYHRTPTHEEYSIDGVTRPDLIGSHSFAKANNNINESDIRFANFWQRDYRIVPHSIVIDADCSGTGTIGAFDVWQPCHEFNGQLMVTTIRTESMYSTFEVVDTGSPSFDGSVQIVG